MPLTAAAICLLFTLLSLLFTTLNYALRDFSRSRLEQALAKRNRASYFDETVEHADDLTFMTATARLICNLCVVVSFVAILDQGPYGPFAKYALALAASLLVLLVFSLAVPYGLAVNFGEPIIARFVRSLHWLWIILAPAANFVHNTEKLIGRAAPQPDHPQEKEHLQQEVTEQIIDAVEEGKAAGVVDERQKQLIERVISFEDRTTESAMTARQDIVSLPIDADLATVRKTIHDSGHSRVPVYEGDSLDRIIGMVYARDLLNLWDQPHAQFDLRSMLRTPLYVPPSKPLRDLLNDFRLQKVHIAVVVDEHGGTAGLITIEDALEELVGDISDEYEPTEPQMFKKVSETTAEADARIEIDELNRLFGTAIPEDGDYSTLAGFVTSTLGQIPDRGTEFTAGNAKYTVLEVEPTRVVRMRIEIVPVSESTTAESEA
ncbi:MAG: hemolysin family protein [Tepidisphaeraceae bacterium]